MSGVPVRIRVTLAYTLAMAVLLAALGAFLYLQLRADLDDSLDDSLRSRYTEVAGLVAAGGAPRGSGASLGTGDEAIVQLLRRDGTVAYSSARAGEPLVGADELPPPGAGPVEVERRGAPGLEGSARLLAGSGSGLGIVVGASLEDRDETLSRLATLLAIGGPIALLLAAAAGYVAGGAALRPVEAMRARAAAISARRSGERLPVPPTEDELGRLGRTLNEMLGRLEQALERERRFVDDASHELRTPLALHRAELELALRYEDDVVALRRAIASGIEEVDRLVALAEALLVAARSGPEGLELATERVVVGDVAGRLIERFRPRTDEAGRQIGLGPGGGLTVRADSLRLEQALTALLDNALRHGGGPIEVRAEERDGLVAISVSDAGPGFPEGFLAHAFERFSRADEARGRGGAGLGLAIARTIAESHGGTASARNLPHGGAEVTIALPAG